VIFTNLTKDHLDYHASMENYFSAKELLFTHILENSPVDPCFAIINTDSKYGRKMKVDTSAVLWTYGKSDADFTYKITQLSFRGTQFVLKTPLEEILFDVPLIGAFNVENCVAAVLGALSFGVPLVNSAQNLKNFLGVPGRLQAVSNDRGLHVFVDYAHTPDALENVLKTLNLIRGKNKQAKIKTVFGCGGDRDKGKRPVMGKIAETYSDEVFVTNDNPRTEDPDQIIQEICSGFFKPNHCIKEKDRSLAIQKAIQGSQAGDVILIAGKGHEDYQIIGDQKIAMSDCKIAEEILREFHQRI